MKTPLNNTVSWTVPTNIDKDEVEGAVFDLAGTVTFGLFPLLNRMWKRGKTILRGAGIEDHKKGMLLAR